MGGTKVASGFARALPLSAQARSSTAGRSFAKSYSRSSQGIPYSGHVFLDLDPLTDKLCCLLKPAHFRNYSVNLVASSNLTLSYEFFVVENFGIIFVMHVSISLKYELLNTMLEC